MRRVITRVSAGMSTEKGEIHEEPLPAKKKNRPRKNKDRQKRALTTHDLHRTRPGEGIVEEPTAPPRSESPVPPRPSNILPGSFVPPPAPTEAALWVVIPTIGRRDALFGCWKALDEQLGPRDRIIVVASTEEAFDDVFGMASDERIIGILLGGGASVNQARRTALGMVPHDAVVVETGDNDLPDPDCLERIRDAFMDPDLDVVYGNLQFEGEDEPIKKPVWAKGVMHRRCEIRGLHAYRKRVYDCYGGWYEDECPAGDHANAIRWEDAGCTFLSLQSKPLVVCEADPKGMSVARKKEQHMNSQKFARGEYRKKLSVAFVTWGMAGRRTKMLALVDRMYEPVSIYGCKKGQYGKVTDLDEGLRSRTFYWSQHCEFEKRLPDHDVTHIFVDRTCLAGAFVRGGRRVMVDICDLRTQRTGQHEDKDEKILCTSENVYLSFVSEGHREYICEKYGIPESRTAIIPNLPLKSWRPEEALKESDKVPNSIVYYGGITARKGTMWSYRYYYDIFKAFKDAGIEVHIYPSGSRQAEIEELYGEFHLHEKFEHRTIYDVLRRYEVGFAGYEDRAGCPQVAHDYAMKCYPNKATDYMMAGIPTLSYALGLAERDVQNWGVCVSKGAAPHLSDAYRDAIEAKDRIDFPKWQESFCMENQADKIRTAYEWVRGDK